MHARHDGKAFIVTVPFRLYPACQATERTLSFRKRLKVGRRAVVPHRDHSRQAQIQTVNQISKLLLQTAPICSFVAESCTPTSKICFKKRSKNSLIVFAPNLCSPILTARTFSTVVAVAAVGRGLSESANTVSLWFPLWFHSCNSNHKRRLF